MFYQQLVRAGKDDYVLHSFPGLLEFGSTLAGLDRGATFMDEVAFRVVDTKLYSFDKDGVHTEIGEIPGDDRCIFSNDGTNLVIVSEEIVYVYNGVIINVVVDANIAGSKAVTFLNNQMIYTKPNLFIVSNVGDPTTANGLNAADAESQPDALVRAYAFQQTLYMFGTRSNEPYWNSGEGNPPMNRIDGQIFEVGLGAINSIAHTDEALYWLGDDKSIYQATGGVKKRISTTAISNAIESYVKITDAHAYTFTFQGINFYCITFPSANVTWCLNESLDDGGWFELSSGLAGGAYQGTSLVNVYSHNLLMDVSNGKVYKLDINTFTNNSEAIKRQRVTGSINGEILGAKGARVQISRFEMIMETGVGTVSGQGDDPRIGFEISTDGGRSFKPKGWARIGRLGETIIKVEMFTLESFYDLIIRFTTTDPVPYEIYSAVADLRLAGR